MHHMVTILIGMVFAGTMCRSFTAPKFEQPYQPGYRTVGNPNVPLESDCALRAFTIEMAAYIAPTFWKANWTEFSQSAFQMNQCSNISQTNNRQSKPIKPLKTASEKQPTCHQRIVVHDLTGDDTFDGTFERPMKTIQAALFRIRALRTVYRNDHTLCMTIRGGTYYLGTNATTSSSQIGSIALTTNDSNTIIENYQDERVILSGGALLQLQWSIHARTADGGTIMKAQIPAYVNLDEFNELYIDNRRAIVAKYPNGDPATRGLYVVNPGFSYDSESWEPPVFDASVDIRVSEPFRNASVFPYFELGVGGGASVFNPPNNYWSTKSPSAGDNYAVPRGFTVKKGALPRIANWSKPTTGFVHAFHSGYWGSWVFQIASVNSTQNKIMFGRGGFQEARGSRSGGAFYVANIFEELDSPNEWFLDKATRTLYFMPNETMPSVFVASQIPCLISISGSDHENSVDNVTVKGLILTETSNTYMRDYMVPSGGDWSVHRGGAMYLTNTRDIIITRNLFTQLGGNGLALIDYNNATTITLNEYVWLADSAIILVGSTNGIDGFTVGTQPANTLIQSNLIHETGIYIKQSSPVLIAVSRSVSVIGNLMFNMPRAAININDGFFGNHTISWNVLFNSVRETADHGHINSWDRQPFLSDGLQLGVPSLRQHESYIHHNTLFNNYHSLFPLDHDDGSCFYEDSYNFQIYTGRKNYLGHSKTDHHQIYVYADVNQGGFGINTCIFFYTPRPGADSWDEVWINNTCVLYNSSVPYKIGGCDTSHLLVPLLKSNRLYIPSRTEVAFICKVNGTSRTLSLKEWTSYGVDLGTTVETAPDIQTIIEWGREMLQRSDLG